MSYNKDKDFAGEGPVCLPSMFSLCFVAQIANHRSENIIHETNLHFPPIENPQDQNHPHLQEG